MSKKNDKKEYRCPKITDREGFYAPKSAYAENYGDMLMQQMEETISAVVLAEAYPEYIRNKDLEDEKK